MSLSEVKAQLDALMPATLHHDLLCLQEVMEACSRRDEVSGAVVLWFAEILGRNIGYLEEMGAFKGPGE